MEGWSWTANNSWVRATTTCRAHSRTPGALFAEKCSLAASDDRCAIPQRPLPSADNAESCFRFGARAPDRFGRELSRRTIESLNADF